MPEEEELSTKEAVRKFLESEEGKKLVESAFGEEEEARRKAAEPDEEEPHILPERTLKGLFFEKLATTYLDRNVEGLTTIKKAVKFFEDLESGYNDEVIEKMILDPIIDYLRTLYKIEAFKKDWGPVEYKTYINSKGDKYRVRYDPKDLRPLTKQLRGTDYPILVNTGALINAITKMKQSTNIWKVGWFDNIKAKVAHKLEIGGKLMVFGKWAKWLPKRPHLRLFLPNKNNRDFIMGMFQKILTYKTGLPFGVSN